MTDDGDDDDDCNDADLATADDNDTKDEHNCTKSQDPTQHKLHAFPQLLELRISNTPMTQRTSITAPKRIRKSAAKNACQKCMRTKNTCTNRQGIPPHRIVGGGRLVSRGGRPTGRKHGENGFILKETILCRAAFLCRAAAAAACRRRRRRCCCCRRRDRVEAP